MVLGILYRFVFKWGERQTHGVESFLVIRWKGGEGSGVAGFESCLPIEY